MQRQAVQVACSINLAGVRRLLNTQAEHTGYARLTSNDWCVEVHEEGWKLVTAPRSVCSLILPQSSVRSKAVSSKRITQDNKKLFQTSRCLRERLEGLRLRGVVSGPQGSQPLLNMQLRAFSIFCKGVTRAARSRFGKTNEASLKTTPYHNHCLCILASGPQQQRSSQYSPDKTISAANCLKFIRLD